MRARAGETLEQLGRRHGLSPALMERINRRSRAEVLGEGERIVVWVPSAGASAKDAMADASPPRSQLLDPTPTPPLGAPPLPDLLPRLR